MDGDNTGQKEALPVLSQENCNVKVVKECGLAREDKDCMEERRIGEWLDAVK